MDLRILEIASNTENNKVLDNFTHQSKNKNPICGDEMEISLVVKNDRVIEMGYQCKSCIYCQASVSLLPKKSKKKFRGNKKFINSCENIFESTKLYWKRIGKILELFDKKNISRKECLLLPWRTVLKALGK